MTASQCLASRTALPPPLHSLASKRAVRACILCCEWHDRVQDAAEFETAEIGVSDRLVNGESTDFWRS